MVGHRDARGRVQVQERGEPEVVARLLRDEPQRHRQHDVERHVLDHRRGQDDAREGRLEDAEVHHDPRDHRDARDRDRDREHEQERGLVAGRALELREIDELEHAEPDREREQRAGERDQRGGLALATMEDRAQLGAGNEHQQEQPELVDRAEHGRGRAVLREHLRLHLREQRAEDRRAEHQAAEDLADHRRLAKAREQVAAGVGRDHEQPEAEYQARDFSAGE